MDRDTIEVWERSSCGRSRRNLGSLGVSRISSSKPFRKRGRKARALSRQRVISQTIQPCLLCRFIR